MPDTSIKDFEAAIAELETIVKKLEEGDLALEQSLALYQERGDLYGQAATWDSIGYAHDGLDDGDVGLADHGVDIAVLSNSPQRRCRVTQQLAASFATLVARKQQQPCSRS